MEDPLADLTATNERDARLVRALEMLLNMLLSVERRVIRLESTFMSEAARELPKLERGKES